MSSSSASTDSDAGAPRSRRPSSSLDLAWIRKFSVPRSWIDRRVETLAPEAHLAPAREYEPSLSGLLGLIECLDLTTLAGNDTGEKVRSLSVRARNPLSSRLRDGLLQKGMDDRARRVAAVCVFPVFISDVLETLDNSGIPVATVAAGFPHGLSAMEARIREVESAREAGAREIDVVIRREWVLTGQWARLHEEIVALRQAAPDCLLKVILATGELPDLDRVGRAGLVAMTAGADFVKTSTGKEEVNATLPVGLSLARALRVFRERTGEEVGLKPAGGIRTAAQGLAWRRLVRDELGEEALDPGRFRIGASSLLDDVVAEVERILTNR